MKILVTGASGLLGHHVVNSALRRGHQVIAQHHSQPLPQAEAENVTPMRFDLSQIDLFTTKVLDIFPDAIIHCAALSNPASVDENPDLAQAVNAELPEKLAQVAFHLNAQMVHISTDMVFNGMRGNYRSTDKPYPTNLYGKLKLEAEERVLESGGYAVTVLRIPIQTGNSPGGSRSVHEKILEACASGKRPTLFTDEKRQPCSADNTAEVCIELCERNDLHGIFHWAGSETISRYDMGLRLLDHFGLPHELIEPTSVEGDPKLADRPRDLTLDINLLQGKLRTRPQSYAEQIEELSIPPQLRQWYHAL